MPILLLLSGCAGPKPELVIQKQKALFSVVAQPHKVWSGCFFDGDQGAWQLQSSADLAHWTVCTNFVVTNTGTVIEPWTEPLNQQQKFYRLMSLE